MAENRDVEQCCGSYPPLASISVGEGGVGNSALILVVEIRDLTDGKLLGERTSIIISKTPL